MFVRSRVCLVRPEMENWRSPLGSIPPNLGDQGRVEVGAHMDRSRYKEENALPHFHLVPSRHKRPIAAHFHSSGLEFAYFGKDFGALPDSMLKVA